MAPKKKSRTDKASSSRSAASFDTHRFPSQAASDHFYDKENQRNFVEDRYFMMKNTDEPAELFEFHGLQGFTRPTQPRVGLWVKELYANYVARDGDSYYCRGTWVEISEELFREYYNLPEVTECAYQAYFVEGAVIPWDEVGFTLTEEAHPIWHNKVLKKSQLTKHARFWLHFINSNVMTTSHTSDSTQERALLAYCLMTQKRVNLPRLMFENFGEVARDKTKVFAFPHMLTAVLTSAGCQRSPGDDEGRPKGPLKYEKLHDKVRPQAQEAEEGDEGDEEHDPPALGEGVDTEAMDEDAVPPPPGSWEQQIYARFDQLEQHMNSRFDHMGRDISAISSQMQQLLTILGHPPAAAPPPQDPTDGTDTAGPS